MVQSKFNHPTTPLYTTFVFHSCSIIEDFEDITAFVAGRIIVVTPDVVFVAENVSKIVLCVSPHLEKCVSIAGR